MPIDISAEVRQALADHRGVVALESAVITHGLPADAAVEAVNRQWQACLQVGALPAVVAVFEGRFRVGISLDDCVVLSRREDAVKVSPWNLASSLSRPGFGGTTVAATILAATLARIPVVSTGGIGGVHPGDPPDVSSDLVELGRNRVVVICAGPKSTLDRQATLEHLETLGVPVIGWRSDRLAGFLAESTELPLPARVDSVLDLAGLLRSHWELGGHGVVISQPLVGEAALPSELLTEDGGAERGPGRTPAELRRLQQRLGPRMVETNLALLEQNARLAARIAVELAKA
ncbi:MAG TPA: pseudouridine-5'-phosphate glycosidase [Candidatus Dormibacteraeota bacterium]|nr:pseudouridine-5'-phosphate glycosidase [Candidatus Dormibacteraeota bacterium]